MSISDQVQDPAGEAPQLCADLNLMTMLQSMILEALAENFKAASPDLKKGQNKGHRNNSQTHKESAQAHMSDAEYDLKERAGSCVHNTSD